jgi:hypothetical protein
MRTIVGDKRVSRIYNGADSGSEGPKAPSKFTRRYLLHKSNTGNAPHTAYEAEYRPGCVAVELAGAAPEVPMLKRNRTTALITRCLAALAAGLVSATVCAGAGPGPSGAPSADLAAVWVPKEVNFVYVGFTTKYSCDGLQDRVRRILLRLGARDDLKLIRYNCIGFNAPETHPGVRILMHVLQPASAGAEQTVAARWQTVDVFADRDPFDAARDCELISQLDRDVVPLFTARHIDYSATCSVHTPLVGGTRLKLDVLVPEQGTPSRAAAR